MPATQNAYRLAGLLGSQQQQQKYVGQRAKLAARPPGILPVLPMASPPLLKSTSDPCWRKYTHTNPGQFTHERRFAHSQFMIHL